MTGSLLAAVGIFLLQAPAGDELADCGLVVGAAVVGVAVGEISRRGRRQRRPIIGFSGSLTKE
ncbi:MAG: hypothetical protein MZU84_09220 [Sphingobacterium sp.]|nr:hypothetical protein [Sphingobacterium sp.]